MSACAKVPDFKAPNVALYVGWVTGGPAIAGHSTISRDNTMAPTQNIYHEYIEFEVSFTVQLSAEQGCSTSKRNAGRRDHRNQTNKG